MVANLKFLTLCAYVTKAPIMESTAGMGPSFLSVTLVK